MVVVLEDDEEEERMLSFYEFVEIQPQEPLVVRRRILRLLHVFVNPFCLFRKTLWWW
jgi:hypothetical protein